MTVWVEFIGLNSTEVYANQQEQNREMIKCRIRYIEGLNSTGYKVKYRGKEYNIESLYDPDESRKYWHMRLVGVSA